VIGIGELATILTVAGVSIYVLGLMGLAITIRLRLASNISIAWYAVSLLPRTVVAGHGVRIWLTWPIALTLILLPVAYWIGTRPTQESIARAEDYLYGGTVIVAGIITLVAFFRIARRQGGLRLVTLLDTPLLVFGTLMMAVIGSGTLSVAAQVISEVVIDAQRISPANSHIVAGTMLLFVGGFFVGLPAALIVEPPLPHVEVTRKNSQSAARGRLVNHSEGFWHLFVGSNSNMVLDLRDLTYELLSIPDAEVLAVRTIGAADTSRAEAAKVDTEKDN
jgi:hypothetical protein